MNDYLIQIISIFGGFIAGIINTLAGNGSTITLGILTEVVGLPANIANGTNRIGVLFQSIASYSGLKKNVNSTLTDNKRSLILIFMGAIIGAITATRISNENFQIFYKILMVVMLFTILAKPSRWIKPNEHSKKPLPLWLMNIILLLLGFYGGFIQMGMGLIFLAIMVLLEGKNMMETNLLKVFVIMIFSIFVLGIFMYNGLVDWKSGISLALGQAAGGWVAGTYIAKGEKANSIAYYTLLVMVIIVLIKMFFF